MIEMMPDFLLRALLAGIGVAALAGPFGSLIVWQRMAFFGDALAHASLLGISLSLLFAVNTTLGVLAVTVLLSLVLNAFHSKAWFSNDTLLGILSHTGLALGLLSFSFLPSSNVDMMSYLYGDILAVGWQDVGLIFWGGIVVLFALNKLWSSLLQTIIHPDLAQVEGVNIQRTRLMFIALLAFVVAMGIKMVGVLLMTALLIIPAATARCFAKSPEKLAMLASVIGIIGVISGTFVSYFVDVPTGPAMVAILAFLFITSTILTIKYNN